MRFWDSSALIPLIAEEPGSTGMRLLLSSDARQVVWWAAVVECESALCRVARERAAPESTVAEARRRLDAFARAWLEIGPSEKLRSVARRLLRVHTLRASDALQLAAAFFASEEEPESLPFVCLDARLSEAARREGFIVMTASSDSNS